MSFPPGGRQSVGGLSTVGCSVSDGALWLTWVGRVRRVGAGVLWVVCGGWECQMFLSWWVYELVRWRAGAGGGGVRVVQAYRFALDPSAAQGAGVGAVGGGGGLGGNGGRGKCRGGVGGGGVLFSAGAPPPLGNAQ